MVSPDKGTESCTPPCSEDKQEMPDLDRNDHGDESSFISMTDMVSAAVVNTSLHGIPGILGTKRVGVKVFWTCVVLASFGKYIRLRCWFKYLFLVPRNILIDRYFYDKQNSVTHLY